MSDVASRVLRIAEESLVSACWRQWQVLAGEGWVTDEPVARSIIDPEALVLASLSVRQREARLRDRALWWASTGAHLMSLSRLKTIMAVFPQDLSGGVALFAQRTRDARWARLAESAHDESEPARTDKGPSELRFLEPSTLMLRLRAGFGVGAKADLLAFLLGASALHAHELRATAAGISRAIQFSPSSVRRATQDMCLAGLIEASRDRPPTYSVDVQGWGRLLASTHPSRTVEQVHERTGEGSQELAAWRSWGHVFPLLSACARWASEVLEKGTRPVVQASSARDITEGSAHLGRLTGWRDVDARAAPGERYLEVFEAFVEHVAGWVEQNV